MAINIRRVGEVADGSITSIKLATGAVNLDTDKVTGQLPTNKMKDGAVNEDKLASLAVSTAKLQDNVVTLAKADDDIRLNTFIGDETIVSCNDETAIKELTFPVSNGKYKPSKMRFIGSLKVDTTGATGTLKVFINDEETSRATMNTTETDYELVNAEFDISDLSEGKQKVVIKMSCDVTGALAFNDLVDILLIK